MKIVDQGYEILSNISDGGISELQLIESAGRTCYKSEDRITEDGSSALKLIGNTFLPRHHESPIEFSFLAVRFTTDRGITHELVRHRLFSFAQESTRYCRYSNGKFGNEISVIRPIGIEEGTPEFEIWKAAMEEAEKRYMALLDAGVTPEMARSVLPTCVKADLNMAGNYRCWREMFSKRCAPGAHPQVRALMAPLVKELQDKIPLLFDDIDCGE